MLLAASPGVWRVGVITFYRAQARAISRLLSREEGHEAEHGVEGNEAGTHFVHDEAGTRVEVTVATVDSFQGSERDVVLVSCVRAGTQGVGLFIS